MTLPALWYTTNGGEAQLFTDTLVFKNGKVLKIPGPIKSERGGWYYHPIVRTKNGKKPYVLGRAEEGLAAAKEAAKDILEAAYGLGDWGTPIRFAPIGLSDMNQAETMGRNSLSWQVETNHGHMVWGIGIRSDYRLGEDNAKFAQMVVPTAVMTAITQEIYTFKDRATRVWATLPDPEPMIGEFRSKGITAFSDLLRSNQPLDWFYSESGYNNTRDLEPDNRAKLADWLDTEVKPVQQFDPEWFNEALTQTWTGYTHFMTDSHGNETASSYRASDVLLVAAQDWRESYLNENLQNVLSVIETAYKNLGVTVRFQTQRHQTPGGYQNILANTTIEIPEGGKDNEHGHKIILSRTGVQVECGYIEEESNFVHAAASQAISDIQNLLE